jgi:hypothetical protein
MNDLPKVAALQLSNEKQMFPCGTANTEKYHVALAGAANNLVHEVGGAAIFCTKVVHFSRH